MSGKSLIAPCIAHEDKHPSMQVFADGWCQCHAGCGRFHIGKYFPEFNEKKGLGTYMKESVKPVPAIRDYKKYEMFSEWESMKKIPSDHIFKGIPVDVLNDLGWRLTDGVAGLGPGYFIPYFNHQKTSIPFGQVRHLSGDRRFSFLPDAEMTMYGKWNVGKSDMLFLVEGTSDAAVMEHCMVPWVAVPSASQVKLVEAFAMYCFKNGITVVFAGDIDAAGDKIRQAIDLVAPYRVCQPPKEYKDWGDFFEARGADGVLSVVDSEMPRVDNRSELVKASGLVF